MQNKQKWSKEERKGQPPPPAYDSCQDRWTLHGPCRGLPDQPASEGRLIAVRPRGRPRRSSAAAASPPPALFLPLIFFFLFVLTPFLPFFFYFFWFSKFYFKHRVWLLTMAMTSRPQLHIACNDLLGQLVWVSPPYVLMFMICFINKRCVKSEML